MNNTEQFSNAALFCRGWLLVYHLPKATSDYWKQTQMTPKTVLSNKQLFLFLVIKFLKRTVFVLASAVGLLGATASWGPADSHTLSFTRATGFFVSFVELLYTSLCHFCFLFRADLGGRDSLDWQAQMDPRSDLIVHFCRWASVIPNWTFSPWLSFMIMYELNMCKLDVNPLLPQWICPLRPFQMNWPKIKRHEYVFHRARRGQLVRSGILARG